MSLSEVSRPFFTARWKECDSASIINVSQVIDTQDIDKRATKYELDRDDTSSLSAKQTKPELCMFLHIFFSGKKNNYPIGAHNWEHKLLYCACRYEKIVLFVNTFMVLNYMHFVQAA